jgi:DNA-directed RNA polymerase specialized sigma24 family protein
VYEASALATADADDAGSIFSHLIGGEPDPALVVEMAASCRRLLEMLPTAELRDIAVWKLEGYTNEEIAAKMNGGKGRSVKAVERKLVLIRKIWTKEIRS